MSRIPQEAFDLIRELDVLLTKVKLDTGDAASRAAVTRIGEQLFAMRGIDLLTTVQDLFIVFGHDDDDEDPKGRVSQLGLCWDGIGDEHECFIHDRPVAPFTFD